MGNWFIIVFMYAIIQIELNEKNRTARTTEMVKMHVNLPHRHTDTQTHTFSGGCFFQL